MRVVPVYGGQPIGQQLRAFRRRADIVVATPGRAVDHLTRGTLRLDDVRTLVLDEADEMLDMGFAEDLDTLLRATPADERQTALFSATIPAAVAGIARRHLREPARITIRPEPRGTDDGAGLREVAYVVRRADKLAALGRVLDLEDPASAVVFARTRGETDELAHSLSARGHDAAPLHGGMSQEQRDRVMGRFREGSLDILVATDVAARGLDIEQVSHVVNFDVPSAPDMYVHRVGRTGRAGRSGVAITLVEPREHRLLRAIEQATGRRLGIGQLPTLADIREHRLELLGATLRETLLEDGFHRYRGVVEALCEEFDPMDIALAALSLADASATSDEDEAEIAPARLPTEERPSPRGRRPERPGPPPRRPPRGGSGWTRLYVGGGRRAGLRPSDIVGAIVNESGVPGAAIGAIQIADGFALVEVASDQADRVVGAMRHATIRGKDVSVRLDRSA
jgi:ATP-dependent RNA helicase DeaD